MKNYKILVFASSVLALAACADLNEFNENPESKDTVTVEASIELPAAETKTHIGTAAGSTTIGDKTYTDSYPVVWSEGDKIALLSETGKSVFTIRTDSETIDTDVENGVTTGPGKRYARFEGEASQVVGEFPNTLVFPAAYPADGAFAEKVENTIWVGSELPMIQSFVGSTTEAQAKGFADNIYPMAAAATDPAHYHFYNMAGIIRLKIWSAASVTDEEGNTVTYPVQRITRITLKNNNGKPITGPVAMAFNTETGEFVTSSVAIDNGKTVKAYGTDGSANAIIDLSGFTVGGDPSKTGIELPQTEAGALEFNIAVIPQDFDEGFTVEIMDATNMGTSKWVSDGAISVRRSEIKEMTAIDYVQPEPMGIANCFQLRETGEYLLPAYAYGNRLDIKIGLKGGSGPEMDPGFVPEKLDAAIYWTDIVDPATGKMPEPNPISNLQYLRFANGINYMSFKVNEDTNRLTLRDDEQMGAYRGNVVIALYNAETKQIFWTWHMWLTDTPKDVLIDGACASGSYNGVYPDGTPLNYEADATSGKMLIMDRNLGAAYAYPDSCKAGEEWKTYGLYYQDGRKDPFIGGNYNGDIGLDGDLNTNYDEKIKSLHKFESTPFGTGTHVTWTNPMFKDWSKYDGNITLTSAIRDPHCYSFDKTKTWQWTNCQDPDNQSWMTESQYTQATHGKTGLTFGGHEAYWNRTKTIMDPCPPGYSVLGERGGYFFKGGGTKTWRTNEANNGRGYGLMYTVYNNDIWWPAAGVRSCEGLMAGVGEYGFYFFYDHISADHGGHGVIFHTAANNGGNFDTDSAKDAVITNHATPIRCVRDKQGEYAVSGGDNKKKGKANIIAPVN